MIRRGLLRAGPQGTLEALYRRHVKEVYGYTLAILDRQADAEDATQTTFMNAYRALERGERPRDGGKWLRAIALNVCREHYRRAGRRPDEVSLEEDPGDLVLDPPVPEIGDVLRGLSALPFNQRAALVMREFEGRSLTEIASELEVSSSAVEALLFRARRGLREQLEGSLTCTQAEEAISRQLDGALPRAERGQLRAHLRECPECASAARRLRAQRRLVRSMGMLLPLPASLSTWKLAGAGATATPAAAGAGPFLAKLAVVVVAGTATVGAGYAALKAGGSRADHSAPARRLIATALPIRPTVERAPTGDARKPSRADRSTDRARGRRTRFERRRVAPQVKPISAVVSHSSAQPGGGSTGPQPVSPRGAIKVPRRGGGIGRGLRHQKAPARGQSRGRVTHAPGHVRVVARPRRNLGGRGTTKPRNPAKPRPAPRPPAAAPGSRNTSGGGPGSSGKH